MIHAWTPGLRAQATHLVRSLLTLALLGSGTAAVQAQSQAPSDAANAVWEEASKVSVHGPKDIALTDQATLKLPEGRIFIPQPQASKVLQAMGNPGKDSRLQGLIFPKGDGQWFMTVRYEASGYIKDDDAKAWNADDLLKSYREGTEAVNEERVKLGAPALEIIGWAEKPAYDASTQRLVWAMSSREKGGSAKPEDQGVNYNTYLLGREGYFSLNLVTGLANLPQQKPEAHAILAAVQFQDGKRYADFNPSTDKMAEYGLAALVLGVGAKKLGLLAVAAAFLAKFAKLFIFIGLGGLAFVGKLFSRKKKDSTAG